MRRPGNGTPLVMFVWLIPAPRRTIALLMLSVELQVADPADTITVSPVAALFTQEFTLAKSGVADQLGLAPVQAASVVSTVDTSTPTRTNKPRTAARSL